MSEKPNTPRKYTNGFYDLINSESDFDRNVRQVAGPIVLENNENFSIFEYVKCNRKNHWKEHVTLNRMDNTETVKVDQHREACTCL